LYPALSAAERISFRQVNRRTGNRLRHQLVDSGTGEVVEAYDKGRGYETGENQFLIVQDEELESAEREARGRPFTAATQPGSANPVAAPPTSLQHAPRLAAIKKRDLAPSIVPPPVPAPVRIENNRTIELDRFLSRGEIDQRYYNTPYYIVPRDEVGQEAFAVIRDAMVAKGLVGMGRVVLANRERPLMIEPLGNGLLGITLRYAHEVRSETEYFADIPQMTLPAEMLSITQHILETKKEDFDVAYLEDRYRTVLVEKLRQKQAQIPTRKETSGPSPKNVINLMDTLKRSLATEQSRPSTTGKSSARRAPTAPKTSKRSRN